MYKAIFLTHQVVVTLFLLIYLIKTILLLLNKHAQLVSFSKMAKIPEMVVSVLFLLSGGYMLTQLPELNSLMIFKLIAVFVSIPLAVIGFKKSNKVLASLSLLLIMAAYGLAEVSKKRSSKTESAVHTNSLDGKDIYTIHCTKCHGADGKLGLVGASDLSTSVLDRASTRLVVEKGKGAMVGFAEQLSGEQMNAVAEYIELLRR